MKVVLPDGCGNAPRIGIVGDFVTNWARRDAEAMGEWLTDDARWAVVGRAGSGAEAIADSVGNADTLDLLEFTSIITHGRLASCDGIVVAGGRTLHFSHAFTFAGATKTAKIKDARSYLILGPA
ncbi:nuclear transport factor 2 family protein [Gulosibacter sediminis]|uniref:nuclear transport factor 2 family protein n=1 Tax=Gulosibacter sediminis TaxID=1729695 RepID=UPI0018696BC6|nr:nuclear transport factor 2 family protein [Gulosibacter sediminis]